MKKKYDVYPARVHIPKVDRVALIRAGISLFLLLLFFVPLFFFTRQLENNNSLPENPLPVEGKIDDEQDPNNEQNQDEDDSSPSDNQDDYELPIIPAI